MNLFTNSHNLSKTATPRHIFSKAKQKTALKRRKPGLIPGILPFVSNLGRKHLEGIALGFYQRLFFLFDLNCATLFAGQNCPHTKLAVAEARLATSRYRQVFVVLGALFRAYQLKYFYICSTICEGTFYILPY